MWRSRSLCEQTLWPLFQDPPSLLAHTVNAISTLVMRLLLLCPVLLFPISIPRNSLSLKMDAVPTSRSMLFRLTTLGCSLISTLRRTTPTLSTDTLLLWPRHTRKKQSMHSLVPAPIRPLRSTQLQMCWGACIVRWCMISSSL